MNINTTSDVNLSSKGISLWAPLAGDCMTSETLLYRLKHTSRSAISPNLTPGVRYALTGKPHTHGNPHSVDGYVRTRHH